MGDPRVTRDAGRLLTLRQEYADLDARLHELYEEWEKHAAATSK